MKNLQKQTQKRGQIHYTLLYITILFLSFNDVSKIEFVNILSVKETVFDATLNGLVIKGM